jgi:hypothetical protein
MATNPAEPVAQNACAGEAQQQLMLRSMALEYVFWFT